MNPQNPIRISLKWKYYSIFLNVCRYYVHEKFLHSFKLLKSFFCLFDFSPQEFCLEHHKKNQALYTCILALTDSFYILIDFLSVTSNIQHKTVWYTQMWKVYSFPSSNTILQKNNLIKWSWKDNPFSEQHGTKNVCVCVCVCLHALKKNQTPISLENSVYMTHAKILLQVDVRR